MWSWQAMTKAFDRDKKSSEGAWNFIVPTRAGQVQTVTAPDPELVRAINRIGININQIAKQTNTGQEVGNAVLIALLELQTTLDKALASSVPDDR